MKRQVVAILIAIAVISCLLTVSVLSEEAYTPIIQSVTVSPTEIVHGEVVTFTVTAKSNAPVKYVCYKDPGGTNCIGCRCINVGDVGIGCKCTKVGDDLWKCEWTRKFPFSEWAPAATYTYSPIYVINEGELRSDEWPHSITVNVTRPVPTPTLVPTPTPVTPTPPEEEGFGGYNVSLCDAIVISIGNATVTDFLNATNITTVQVSDFKGYKGGNTWRVQWSFSNRLLDVYLNGTTGNIVGIEEKTALTPTPETKTWHSVITFSGSGYTVTEPFTIKGDEWRIQYTVTHPSDGLGGHFSAFVFPRGQTKGAITYWSSPNDSYERKHYVFKGCGDFYMDIHSYRSQWELKVEDYY